jgi:hypothetical protein
MGYYPPNKHPIVNDKNAAKDMQLYKLEMEHAPSAQEPCLKSDKRF